MVFPDPLHVSDESVNEFIRTVTRRILEGNYESFRAMFSAKVAPISEAQYERAWQSVARIEIRVVEQMRQEHTEDWFYAVFAHVTLDPEDLPADVELERDVGLLIIPEHDEWKLDYAPEALRTWLANRAASPSPAPEAHPPVQANHSGG